MAEDKFKKVKPELFKAATDKVREGGDLYKANIHPYTLDEYQNMETFLSPDGQSGYAIKPGGELVGVHSTVKGRGNDIVEDAVKRGAKKLDAYDIKGKLPELYSKHGFEETGRFPFDPQYADDLDILREERPDFVTMERKAKVENIKSRQDYLKAKDLLDRAKKKAAQEGNTDLVQKADLYDKRLEKQIARGGEGIGSTVQRGRGFTEKISNAPLKQISGTDLIKKIAKSRAAKKLANRGLKALPIVGGLASAFATGDVQAAVPILGEADDLGPEAGSPEAMVEDPSVSREQRMKVLEELRKRNKL